LEVMIRGGGLKCREGKKTEELLPKGRGKEPNSLSRKRTTSGEEKARASISRKKKRRTTGPPIVIAKQGKRLPISL